MMEYTLCHGGLEHLHLNSISDIIMKMETYKKCGVRMMMNDVLKLCWVERLIIVVDLGV